MRQFHVNDHVRLMMDIPDLWLHHGESGVICSRWSEPMIAFEVEFHTCDPDEVVRTLVMPEALEVEEEALVEAEPLIIPDD